ncbi:hypothetical protein [Thermoanaerobacterium thermosaccharolyticum]|uniref:hypothetical protein n=1 Tax=Thermoanaerobacterium thermosaccharolyticum TaxID=1517 RepID=UPI002FD8FA98
MFKEIEEINQEMLEKHYNKKIHKSKQRKQKITNKYKYRQSKFSWNITTDKPWKKYYVSSGKYRYYARRKARRIYNNINKTDEINNTSYKKIYDVWWAIF